MIKLRKSTWWASVCVLGVWGDGVAGDPYYYSAKHRRWREAVLRRAGYLCEECKRYGRVDADGLPVQAVTAHHIKPREMYPELQYLVSNGRALCLDCHNKAHPEKGKQGRKGY